MKKVYFVEDIEFATYEEAEAYCGYCGIQPEEIFEEIL